MLEFKAIKTNNKPFLYRFSIHLRERSLKLHLIVDDDSEMPHKHPWNFITFLFMGSYKELKNNEIIYRYPFQLIKNFSHTRHRVILYRIFGVKLPCITIGLYGKKIEPWCERTSLCEKCKPLGYCYDQKSWED